MSKVSQLFAMMKFDDIEVVDFAAWGKSRSPWIILIIQGGFLHAEISTTSMYLNNLASVVHIR
jgi:hypothetical protein